MPPPDKDNTAALTAIAVHLGKLDERSEGRSGQLDKIEEGVDKINGRLRQVEQEQAAMRGRSNMLDGILAAATVIGTTLGITVKQ